MADAVRKGHAAIAPGVQIAAIEHPLGKRMAHCARCQDSGSVWIVCPDAGAVKVPCECRQDGRSHGLALADIGAAAVFAGGCAALFLLL
jgi:hypothetical protein